jgi:hypothetical protein
MTDPAIYTLVGVIAMLGGLALGWVAGLLYGTHTAPARCTRIFCRLREDGNLPEKCVKCIREGE